MRRIFFVWSIVSLLVIVISLATGYRASRAAGVPQYLFTKTRVIVERPLQPADAREAEIQRRFTEAGEAPTDSQLDPMFVLGLLDGAMPILAAWTLLAVSGALWRRRLRHRRAAAYHAHQEPIESENT